MTSAVMPRANTKAQYETIEKTIREREDQIVATLVPTIPRERFINVALQAITRSPRLLECTPASIVKALRDAAELGLEPSGLMGSAYLVPYRNRKSSRYEAQLIPGYRGLIDLARRSGEVKTIEAHVVRERDTFDYSYGTDAFLTHRPWLNRDGATDDEGAPLDAGKYVAAYAFARLTSGEVQFEVMDVPAIEAVRSRSKAADEGPWATDWPEMARKTPTRRMLKYLPLSVTALQRALELEDIAEGESVAVSSVAPARKALSDVLSGLDDDGPHPDSTEGGNADPEPSTAPTEEYKGFTDDDQLTLK